MKFRERRTVRHATASGVPPVAAGAPAWPERGFDVVDAPPTAGHRVLLQLERIGAPLGPVLAVADRLYFFVEAGSTTAFPTDLSDLGWNPGDVDLRALDARTAAATITLPPPGNPRWVRGPEVGAAGGRVGPLPSAHLLVGSLAYACRRGAAASAATAAATQATHRKAA